MSDSKTEKNETETLRPLPGGVALHRHGEHACLVPYTPVREGEDLRGKPVFMARGDGAYERFDAGGGVVHGPTQGWRSLYAFLIDGRVPR
jgi:hypothetical protein